MRIISDKKDYYDCIQAYGQDQTLLYIRKPEEVKLEAQWKFPSLRNSWWFSFEVTQHIIGFCGKIYPMLEMHGYSRDNERFGIKCFSIKEVDAFVEKHVSKDKKNSYYGKPGRRWWKYGGQRRSEFTRFFEDCEKQQEAFLEMFLEKHCPVFVGTNSNRKSKIVYNALLRPYDFVRIFDPYTAFQEIAMFMGNMAMPEKEMPIISDEMKIHSRGFNKWSFRRTPGGK